MDIVEYVMGTLRTTYGKLHMKLLGLVRKLKPINEEEFIRDWHDGMKWPEMRAKYGIGSYRLFEIAKQLGLPPRNYGTIPATNLQDVLQRYDKIKEPLTKDYIAGLPISEIKKKYKIAYPTFRAYVIRYYRLRKENMRKKLVEKRQNSH